MKFTTDREALLRPLQLVTGVVERRQTLPVLANLLVQVSEDRVQMTGTDLEVELVGSAAVNVTQPGEATLPARKLADIWRSLPEGSQVSVEVEGDRAIVRSGRSRFALATLPAQEFPKVEAGEGEVTLEMAQADVKSLIDQVSFAMAQQDVRYFLNGMLLEVSSEHVRAVATDGHRLAMCTKPGGAAGAAERVQVIVPRKGVLELTRMLDGGDEKIQLQLGSNHLRASLGDFQMTTKLVDGKFPDYDKVIPRDASRAMVADRETLRHAFQRAAILSNEKYRGVRLVLEGEDLTVQANNPEQEEAEETVSVEFSGERLEIGFNVSYLQDVLGVLATDEVRFSVSDANSSAVIEGPGNDEALYVVMPMRL